MASPTTNRLEVRHRSMCRRRGQSPPRAFLGNLPGEIGHPRCKERAVIVGDFDWQAYPQPAPEGPRLSFSWILGVNSRWYACGSGAAAGEPAPSAWTKS